MLGELNPDEIELLLKDQLIGRIGCSANGVTYVVPVTYAYDGKYIYAHSKEGRKIQMMRINPFVCFEVDKLESPANWQCAIIWGKYEELMQDDQEPALSKLMDRLRHTMISETSFPEEGVVHQNNAGPYKSVIFRIEIKEKSGRYERR